MRVLLDTDIVLDLLLARADFVDEAAALFDLHDRGYLQAYISAITPANIFYIARKLLGRAATFEAITELLAAVEVCSVNSNVLQKALSLEIKDYEDAIQVAGALVEGLDAIITRNLTDYKNSPVPTFSPADFLATHTPNPAEQ